MTVLWAVAFTTICVLTGVSGVSLSGEHCVQFFQEICCQENR